MSVELVVARYREDLAWLKDVPRDIQITIYNKGKDFKPDRADIPVITLRNVGREGETYAQHIVRRYDTLADTTVFTQGNPFDHFPPLVEFLKNRDRAELAQTFFQLLTHNKLVTNLTQCPYHKEIPMRSVYTRIMGASAPMIETFAFGPGAIFVASKAAIHSHDLKFYENLRTMLVHSNCPIEGYVVERMWNVIFDPKTAPQGAVFDIKTLTPTLKASKTPAAKSPTLLAAATPPTTSTTPATTTTSSSGSLSAGEIAAIVIACVAFLLFVIIGVVFLRKRSNKSQTTVLEWGSFAQGPPTSSSTAFFGITRI